MSEQDDYKDEHSGRTEISCDPDEAREIQVTDFIEYGESVDERMMELVNTGKESREMNPNKMNWDHRENAGLHSDSDEDYFPKNETRNCSASRENKENLEKNIKADNSGRRNSRTYGAGYQDDVEEKSINDIVEDLKTKFSIIRLLRRKEDLRKVYKKETLKPSCIPGKSYQSFEEHQQILRPQDILRCLNFETKSQDSVEKKLDSSANSDEIFPDGKEREEEEDDDDDDDDDDNDNGNDDDDDNDNGNDDDDNDNGNDEIDDVDEIVHMMSSSVIEESDEYHDFCQGIGPEENQEKCLDSSNKKLNTTADSEIDVLESLKDAESQETSQNQSLNDAIFDWKADTSTVLSSIFDGYEIDDPSSFHDWMVNDILSKSLNRSYDLDLSLCAVCFSYHKSDQECVED